MIFSVSTVCFAYVIGLTSGTFYIRRLKLVGAGFFWMMHSTVLVLSFLGLLSEKESPIVVSGFAVVACGGNLGFSLYKRKQMREDVSRAEYFFYFMTYAFSFAVLVGSTSTIDVGGVQILEIIRLIIGGLLLGGVTTTMLLGHWYLVQPGLTRKPIGKMCQACIVILCIDVVLWCFTPSMFRVFTGTISDGWNGTLGYMWAGASITTLILLIFGYKALQEKSYSAVMATTGLLYLAILVANGVELIPRSIFS